MDSAEHLRVSQLYQRRANDAVCDADRIRFQRMSDGAHKAYIVALQVEYDKRVTKFEARILRKCGDVEAWYEWALTLYVIDVSDDTNQHTVHSKCKDWDKSWTFDNRLDCLQKIEKLIGYKITDRKRGVGNMHDDLASFTENT